MLSSIFLVIIFFAGVGVGYLKIARYIMVSLPAWVTKTDPLAWDRWWDDSPDFGFGLTVKMLIQILIGIAFGLLSVTSAGIVT